MSKNDFLRQLNEALSESFDVEMVKSQIDYYDKYISDEIKKGKSEKEVVDELGDPRLIAKTIKTVHKVDSSQGVAFNDDNYQNEHTENYNDSGSDFRKSGSRYRSYVNTTNTLGCTIAFLIFFIIIMGLFRFFGNVAYGLGALAFSGPIGFLIVLAFIYLFFGGRR